MFITRGQGIVVVQHDDGFAVVELLGNEGVLDTDDTVVGDWDDLGGAIIRVTGKRDKLDVYMQGSWGDFDLAVEMARRAAGY